jgi:uncharacterized protein (TIGR01777 family)
MQTILITGGSGLIGKALTKLLVQKGYRVNILSRKKSDLKNTYYWNVKQGIIEEEAIATADCIIHLAGENVADKRWTQQRKKSLLNSRVLPTRLLLKKVAAHNPNLKSFIAASAVGYYGTSCQDSVKTEESSPGNDFLARICVDWEKEVLKFKPITKVTILRIGVVLSSEGGAYAEISKPIKHGFGAVLGSGNQSIPWIHIKDLCNLFAYAVKNPNIEGIYNAVASEQIDNRKLTQAIAAVIGKKIRLPKVPSFVLKLIFGERSVILLKGCAVSSKKIQNAGFEFGFETIKEAVKEIEVDKRA